MAQDVSNKIDEVLAKPRDVMIDGTRVVDHSLPDLIALEKHRSRKSASPFGFRVAALRPPPHSGSS